MSHPTVVIKLGTSSIVDEKTHLPLLSILALIVETAVALRRNGSHVIIVSSGAIGVALQKMGLPRRPKHLPQVQALAAIGQCRLMGLWDQLFDRLGQPIAQILLTRNDIADRAQYLNAQNTMTELLAMGVIPIVNENDTLAVSEILDRFGDNDTLSAITAGMVHADYLFLMTDVDCLYNKNPRSNPDAKPIEVVNDIRALAADTSSAGSSLGTGGMSTKIVAARLATAAGVTTVITKSSKPGNVLAIVSYLEERRAKQRVSAAFSDDLHGVPLASPSADATADGTPAVPLHTRFVPSKKPIGDRRFWLLHGLTPHGTVFIDPGASRALSSKAGLLPAGIIDVEGSFAQQECVRLVEIPRSKPSLQSSASQPVVPTMSKTSSISDSVPILGMARTPSGSGTQTPTSSVHSPLVMNPDAREIGRAVVNYSAIEIKRIAGIKSTEIAQILGYSDSEYVAVRENIAMLAAGEQVSAVGDAYAISAGLAAYANG